MFLLVFYVFIARYELIIEIMESTNPSEKFIQI